MARRKKVSKQRAWQMARVAEGLCATCGKPRVSSQYCLRHMLAARDRQRRLYGVKKPYARCRSELLLREAQANQA